MNTVVGEKLSIVTPLPQTTRSNLKGVFTTPNMQLVFLDTPGIHKGKHTFNNAMITEANSVFDEGVDVICYLVDLFRESGEEEETVVNAVKNARSQVLIIFNKIDICNSVADKIAMFYARFPELKNAPHIQLSATKPEAKDVFLGAIEPLIPEGPAYFDQDSLTDASLRFFAAEYIRKQVILNTREEVPHATFVEIESYKEEEKKHVITATIHVETVGQRGIIVGKGGSVISKIRKGAEAEMKLLVELPVSISCHIKVTPRWRDNESFLRRMGMIGKKSLNRL